jgi:hypothetical protein
MRHFHALSRDRGLHVGSGSFAIDPAGLACHLVSALTGKRPVRPHATGRHFSSTKVHEGNLMLSEARARTFATDCVPLDPAGRGDASGDECVCNLPQRSRARLLGLARMIGSTLAAYLFASAFTASAALLRATWSYQGSPRDP